jgi:uncharacterized damage-inducible protein DinB
MTALENIRLYIEYHIALSRKVWESIDQLTDAQFLQDDAYSQGSIHHLMVHLVSVDRRWLAGLKNLPDAGHLKVEDYPTRSSARAVFESVAKDLTDYMATLSEQELLANPADLPSPRMVVLMHMVNHGTDHRATVLQKLNAFGAPSFGQDFILWLWNNKK